MSRKETLQPTNPEINLPSIVQALAEGEAEVPQVVQQVDEYVANYKMVNERYPSLSHLINRPEPREIISEDEEWVYNGPSQFSTFYFPPGLKEKLGDEFAAAAEAIGLYSDPVDNPRVEYGGHSYSHALLTAVGGNEINSFLANFKSLDLSTRDRESLYFVVTGEQEYYRTHSRPAIIFLPYQIFSEKSYTIEPDWWLHDFISIE